MKIAGQIIVTENNIIKVNHVTETEIIGFDVITQSCVIISIKEKYIVNPKSILPLLNSERARFSFVNAMFPKLIIPKKSEILGVTYRSYYRIKVDIESEIKRVARYKK